MSANKLVSIMFPRYKSAFTLYHLRHLRIILKKYYLIHPFFIEEIKDNDLRTRPRTLPCDIMKSSNKMCGFFNI